MLMKTILISALLMPAIASAQYTSCYQLGAQTMCNTTPAPNQSQGVDTSIYRMQRPYDPSAGQELGRQQQEFILRQQQLEMQRQQLELQRQQLELQRRALAQPQQ
jgi:hypothetical protein